MPVLHSERRFQGLGYAGRSCSVSARTIAALAAALLAGRAARRYGTRTRSLRLATQGTRRDYPVPGLVPDGEPLSENEERALSDVDMDSLIGIPEPTYRTGEKS
jgi:SOS-response transcriptional repressor LexA